MHIETMDISYYPAVYDLWVNTPGMGLNTLDDSEEGIKRFLLRNPATSFVALENGSVVGIILCGHDGRRGYIYHLSVRADQRRTGLGSSLVTRVMEALRQEGITKAACVVFSHNETGNSFWQAMGFSTRDDLQYRNRVITHKPLVRIDT